MSAIPEWGDLIRQAGRLGGLIGAMWLGWAIAGPVATLLVWAAFLLGEARPGRTRAPKRTRRNRRACSCCGSPAEAGVDPHALDAGELAYTAQLIADGTVTDRRVKA